MATNESRPVRASIRHNQACTGWINFEGVQFFALGWVAVTEKAHIGIVGAYCWHHTTAGIHCRLFRPQIRRGRLLRGGR